MKKINFSKIVVLDIDGNQYMVPQVKDNKQMLVPYDFAKVLGNGLFYKGQDIHLSELGQKIYHHEEVELTDEDIQNIRKFINESFVPFVLLSVNPQLDEMMK